MYCGAVSDANGNHVPVEGVYSNPISINRIENYPVLSDGNLNPAYDPDEAEEKIVAQWATPLGVNVTRTSRAWSFPGYDSFIIYEYELQNATPDTIKDLDAVWTYGSGPSMFGYQRTYNRWAEVDYRGQNGEGNHFGRFDLKRWMIYNHDRDGRPDTEYFDVWSQSGDRGGLNSPQAAGVMMLYYDHDHLATRSQTQQVWVVPNDSLGIWDSTQRVKQPFLHRYENGSLPVTKIQQYMDPTVQRRTGTFIGNSDSLRVITQLKPATVEDWFYWKGRTKRSVNLSWYQPVVHFYGFYPYFLPPNQSIRFALAEVVGYGAGGAGDRIYTDLGGNIRAGADAGVYFNPIQAFTGQPLVKYDSLQYEPLNSRPNGVGVYNTIPIPVPSPIITVVSAFDSVLGRAINRITWGPQVESFSALRLRALFAKYSVLRAPEPLGPWRQLDTVGRHDPRYFRDSIYIVQDDSVTGEQVYYYAVLSVDALGGRSGMTNATAHLTSTDVREEFLGTTPDGFELGQNYPNPFNPTTHIHYELPKDGFVHLAVYDILGRGVAILVNQVKPAGRYDVSFNTAGLASGVYFYGMQAGSFVSMRKMVLMK